MADSATNLSRIRLTAPVLVLLVLAGIVYVWVSNYRARPAQASTVSSGPTFASSVANTVRAPCEEAAAQPETLQTPCRGRKLTAGYVLALINWEQQTAGSANLMSLQCWAATMNMVVVEYFMPTSLYYVPDEILNGTASPQEVVRVRNLYDIGYWSEYSNRRCYAPLVSWEEFLCIAPREVIIVHIAYDIAGGPSTLCNCPPDQKYQNDFNDKYTPFFNAYGFKVIGEVCIETRQQLSTEKFNSAILGTNSASQRTVVIDAWRGVSNREGARVVMTDTKCRRGNYLSLDFAKPSAKVLEDTRLYIEHELKNSDYIAVMVRLEPATEPLWNKSRTQWSPSRCFKGIKSTIVDMKARYNLKQTFWSLDVGKYGTIGFKNYYTGTEPVAEEVFDAMREYYNVSYSDVEASLTGISGMTHPGYIALLQQNIAARANCLVLIGGGSFHAHAKRLYASLHRREFCVVQKPIEWLQQQCLARVPMWRPFSSSVQLQ